MYYNRISKGYNKLHGEEQRKKLDIIKEYIKEQNMRKSKNRIKITKNTKLLDVGCGTGISSDFDCNVIGIDPSVELLKIASKSYKNDKKKRFIHGKAEQLPFDDNSFDVVVSLTAVHNFNNIEKGLKEMKRVGNNEFVISILKKSLKLPRIHRLIKKYFKIKSKIEEDKDIIYFLE